MPVLSILKLLYPSLHLCLSLSLFLVGYQRGRRQLGWNSWWWRGPLAGEPQLVPVPLQGPGEAEGGMRWDEMGWDGMGWDGMGWDGMGWWQH